MEGKEEGKENRKRIEAKKSFVKGVEEEEGRGKGGRVAWETASGSERGLSTKPAPQPRPNSFLYSHYQPPAAAAVATEPRPPEPAAAATSPFSKLPSLAKARSIFPSWLSPSRPPGPGSASSLQPSQQAQRDQQAPLRCRKTRGGRARAVSMNLELETGKGEDGARGRRGERLEARRSTAGCRGGGPAGVPQGSVVGPVAIRESSRLASDPAPLLVLEPASLAPSSSGWTDQGPLGSTAAVLRRTNLGVRDKRKAWRRHTVVV